MSAKRFQQRLALRQELEGVIELCLQLGVSCFNLSQFVPVGRGSVELDIPPIAWKQIMHIWKEKKLKFGNKMNFYTHEAQQILLDDSLFDLPYFTGCQAGNGVCCIKANGDILPCVLLDIPIGNIRENSFSTIWLNSPILEELNNRQKYSEPCVQCIYVEKCGGCRGVAYGSFGDYFAPDPHCWLDSNGERL